MQSSHHQLKLPSIKISLEDVEEEDIDVDVECLKEYKVYFTKKEIEGEQKLPTLYKKNKINNKVCFEPNTKSWKNFNLEKEKKIPERIPFIVKTIDLYGSIIPISKIKNKICTLPSFNVHSKPWIKTALFSGCGKYNCKSIAKKFNYGSISAYLLSNLSYGNSIRKSY